MSGLIHTGLGSSYIIAHVLHSPPPPPANSFVIGPAVINTHKHTGMSPLTIPSSTSRRPRRDMPQLEPKYNLPQRAPPQMGCRRPPCADRVWTAQRAPPQTGTGQDSSTLLRALGGAIMYTLLHKLHASGTLATIHCSRQVDVTTETNRQARLRTCRPGLCRLHSIPRHHIRQLGILMRRASNRSGGGKEAMPSLSPHAPVASVRKSTTAGPREGDKSVWKRKRSRAERHVTQGEKQMGGTKSQASTTKEFVIYSCNICGFNKKTFAALLDYTRPAPPDAMVLTETNLSFTYTPDYVEESGWKIYTVCGPSKTGSRTDTNTGRVSLLVRDGSVKVKTEIMMRNDSHQLVTWALSNSDRGFTPMVYISGVYLAPRAKIPISRTVKALKLLQDNFVLPTSPNSSTAFSSVYHIITGDFNAYTGVVQELHVSQDRCRGIPHRISDAGTTRPPTP